MAKKCAANSRIAIRTSRTAMTRSRVLEASLVAQCAPSHAPMRLPASKLRTKERYGESSARGTLIRRAGIAAMTTTRLIALFMMIAGSAANPNSPISDGRRNSAPPRPIIPPTMRPPGERFVRCDPDGVPFLSFVKDLEQQFGSAAVEFHVAELVDQE